mmetsp:Transcript_1910/g.4820  ORF Transcript_1910/g.4820 Transcript_1910/m.4820 type:complete len:234 (+) Transcript_1910:202-903(+)
MCAARQGDPAEAQLNTQLSKAVEKPLQPILKGSPRSHSCPLSRPHTKSPTLAELLSGTNPTWVHSTPNMPNSELEPPNTRAHKRYTSARTAPDQTTCSRYLLHEPRWKDVVEQILSRVSSHADGRSKVEDRLLRGATVNSAIVAPVPTLTTHMRAQCVHIILSHVIVAAEQATDPELCPIDLQLRHDGAIVMRSVNEHEVERPVGEQICSDVCELLDDPDTWPKWSQPREHRA